MWQRFTERSRRVVFFAQEEAGRLGEYYVSTEHLLLGLVRENDCVAARVLDRMGVSLSRIRSEIERQVTRGDGRLGQDMQLTPRAKRVIDLAYDEARQLSNNYIGTEHLLLGLIREGEGLAGRVLIKLGVELDRTREEVRALQDSNGGIKRDEAKAAPAKHLNDELFHTVYEKLSPEDQAALIGDGLALNRLPAEMQQCVQWMFEEGIKGGTFILDPNSLVRLNITTVEGATHYTLTTKASFLVNFLARGLPSQQPGA
jgi:ATP-dependent Clp protease ATP-binding subunit ClpA